MGFDRECRESIYHMAQLIGVDEDDEQVTSMVSAVMRKAVEKLGKPRIELILEEIKAEWQAERDADEARWKLEEINKQNK